MSFYTPANLLTLARMPLALGLLFTAPLSPSFFLRYTLAGITDILDGPIARRTHTASRCGARLDSLADVVFLIAALFCLLPALSLPGWTIWAVAVIAVLHCAAWLVGFLKHRRFTALHTITNKLTGAALFCAPYLLPWVGTDMLCAALCLLASISAGEELAIQCLFGEAAPDCKSIFHLLKSHR